MRAKIYDSNNTLVNTIIVASDTYAPPSGHTIQFEAELPHIPQKLYYTKDEVLKQFPVGFVKSLLVRARTDDDIATWKYRFELAEEIFKYDIDFVAGIAALKAANLLPNNWELV